MPSPAGQGLIDDIRMVDWAHLKSELIWVYEDAVLPPYDNTREHSSGQSALLILHGRLLVENEVASVEAQKDQWVFPPQGRRLQRFSDNPRVLSVRFHFYWPGGQPLFDWDRALVLESSAIPQLERQTRILQRIVERRMPKVGGHLLWTRGSLKTHLICQRAFDSWLCVYADALLGAGVVPTRLVQIDDRILRAVNSLDGLPLREKFAERRLAAEVGLSTSQLDRLFLKQFHLTPRQYLEGKRVEEAKNLLRSAPLSIKQITYEVGFDSPPSFSRWFRQKTGLSPLEFQKSDES